MTYDETEAPRRRMVEEINKRQLTKEQIAAEHGEAWDTAELQRDFTVHSFWAPFVMVTRKSDSVRGVLIFQHSPRVYWDFQPEVERES